MLLALLAGALAPSEARGAGQLDLARLRPYLTGGKGKVGRIALHAGRHEAAVGPLRAHLKRGRRAPQRNQARYLLAVALLEGRDQAQLKEAEGILSDLVRAYPLLADYHRFQRARALYALRDFTGSIAAAGSVSAGAVLKTDAELIRADALRALGRVKETIPIWEAYLRAHPRGQRLGEAHFRLAAALTDQPRRALEHYKRVIVRAPLSKHRTAAELQVKQLAAALGGGRKLATLTADQRYTQAMVYYRKMRNARSEAGFAAVLAASDLPPRRRCQAAYYRAKSVYKARKRARAAPLFAAAARACRAAGARELVVKSLYNRARGLSRKKDYRGSTEQYAALEREFSRHSYADDARLRAAEVFQAWGKEAKVKQLLASLPKAYPNGDMAREALWRLARGAYLAARYDEALAVLDRIIGELGRARRYYAEGQALYWKARILDKKKRRRAAASHYERCVREYPLSYYALMALNRLRERHPARFRHLRRELILPVGRKARRRWRVALGPLDRDPHFRRGLELARLGFGGDASRELQRAGLGIAGGTPVDRLWLAAALFHQAGIWRLSHQVPRSRDGRYKRAYPLGDNYRRWRIAYPWAFPVPVAEEARRARIPPQLVLSIMREESGFSPKIESYANAVGLMQLILPTARAAGAKFKLKRVDREALHDPATNIKLGAYYLGWLKRTFSGALPLTIAGYNAGHGAVGRWLKRFRGATLDELIERIPYDQTRNYTKRVLSTFFAYSVVHRLRPRIPRIGQALPKVGRTSFRRAKK